jgi:metal-responsive CopG/Arc/MetJ family transcriptional regulator
MGKRLKKDIITVTLDKTLIERITDKCRRTNRSRSNYVETIIKQDLDRELTPKSTLPKEEIAIRFG